MNHLPVLVVVVPLAGGFLISLVGGIKPGLKALTALIVATAHSLTLITAAYLSMSGTNLLYFVGGWPAPIGIVLVVDRFSAFFLLLLAIGHPAAVLFRIGSDNPSEWMGKSATLMALFFAALSGIVVTTDLFNLFVFVELATVCSIGLIARKRRPESAVAGFVYLMVAAVSGGLLLFAVLVLYLSTGSVSMPLVAQAAEGLPKHLHATVTAAVVVSFGIKFGLVPLHFWQPRAYHAAGTTAAGILSAFGMKIYIYALVRLLWLPLQAPVVLPGVFDLLLAAAMINILTGHVMAMIERNLVRMLAFSSVAHVGYILLGVAAAGRAGSVSAATAALVATLFHAGMHALMKSALLWSGHRFVLLSQSSRIMKLGGMARRAPGSIVAFSLAALAIIGIPPSGGFASKWFIALAQTSMLPVLVIGMGTVISLVYYARFFLIVTRQNTASPHDSGYSLRLRPHLETGVVLVLASAAFAAGLRDAQLRYILLNAAEALLDYPEIFEISIMGSGR
jgi:multicomponent Na+:H+ antiporter subunit D